jgi:serine/threonine protein kinase
MTSLIARIGDKKEDKMNSDRKYVARGGSYPFFDEEMLKEELDEEYIKYDDALLTYIMQSAQALFCTLVRSGYLVAVPSLAKSGLTDDYLPIYWDQGTNRVWSLQGAPADDRALEWFGIDVQGRTGGTEKEEKKKKKEYEKWLEDFDREQWLFLAPVFSEHEIVYPLRKQCPLPFTEYNDRSDLKDGATSVIAQGDIHPNHMKIQLNHGLVAIKKIVTDDQLIENTLTQKTVHLEVVALDLARRIKHDHIIRFIASYSQKRKHYFLLEWADGGSLGNFWHKYEPDFWMDSPKPAHYRNQRIRIESRRDSIMWAVEQITGLAGAIQMLHNPPGNRGHHCRHGDLKPANIVRSSMANQTHVNQAIARPENPLGKDPGRHHSRGRLQITDMGLARVHDQRTSLRRTSENHGFAVKYQAPELRFRSSPDEPTSRAIDIWSMGCIMLEFVIWLLYGRDQLKTFSDSFEDRHTFFSGDSRRAFRLRRVVQEWISHIRDKTLREVNGGCVSRALRAILKLTEDHLLVLARPPQ